MSLLRDVLALFDMSRSNTMFISSWREAGPKTAGVRHRRKSDFKVAGACEDMEASFEVPSHPYKR
jgi:hypothetical protein